MRPQAKKEEGVMEYLIDIKGLTSGKHTLEYSLDGSFFESFGSDIILDADLKAMVEVEKVSGWIKVVCDMNGTVVVECDKCLADLTLPVNFTVPFTVKFSSFADEEEEDDGDVIVLGKNDGEVDLSQVFYDYVVLSLPLKRVHPEGECDPVMLKKMSEFLKNN